jgi:hypothetical protein
MVMTTLADSFENKITGGPVDVLVPRTRRDASCKRGFEPLDEIKILFKIK